MINVLIVEDDPMVTYINSNFLKKLEGFNLIKSVDSIAKAKESIKELKPNLILLDVFLPKGNGIDLLKWIRKEEIRSDVILITAEKNIESVQEAFRYGAIDYLIKPFTFNRYKDALLQYKERFNKFKNGTEIEQKTIDKYIMSGNTVEQKIDNINDLEKGLSKHTYNKIWDALIRWDRKHFTSEELAEYLGMARVTVRRYLEYMNKNGKLDIVIEYGKVGRPQHKYKMKKV
ncbi:response regulator [Haloimpatiens sp. FM7330]|uniref:response regulator n=1 Tax=Haloimpatiens sp. FM7330 TaxID=3298610 RepID=UPI0036282A2E